MRLIRIILFALIITAQINAQTDTAASSMEIFIIDSYITPEVPNKFILSFFTSDSATSKLIIMDKKIFDVSKKLSENHKIEIELSQLNLDSAMFKYVVVAYDRKGNETHSEVYHVEIPQGLVITEEQDVGMFRICLGGIVFAIPSPTYLWMNNENHWSITKEIPLFSFYSVGYNYPAGYLGVEYSYVFNANRKNFLRVGYKQIFQVQEIKYISPGLNYFTDFNGYNGLSAELSIGLFQIQNVFTFYTRYRYNFQLQNNGTGFHELSIGLFSNFFSLNL
ncbi:MAG: hypothetical protein FIA82_01925 [Melioribacter sp.]|nr:hypothetical protein [Melioribacter sp.]